MARKKIQKILHNIYPCVIILLLNQFTKLILCNRGQRQCRASWCSMVRICQCKGTQVRFLLQQDLECHRVAKPVRNY